MTRLGVLGGTFDPVHLGHLAVARVAAAALHLDGVRFIPSRVPPHRSGPHASAADRLAMTTLAVEGTPGWSVSDLELRRDGPSYSYDTLTALAAAEHLAPSQICFLIGADAFAEIATWSRYPAVLDLAHFVVVARPGFGLDQLRARVPALAQRMTTPHALAEAPPGATRIVLLEAATPDVSSTAIRAATARGESLEHLVSAPVARYIRQHGLYGA
ncbi:MAG: nicotinate-nucleotide adenylyltransferase [Vicinamibacterales bacterium]